MTIQRGERARGWEGGDATSYEMGVKGKGGKAKSGRQ